MTNASEVLVPQAELATSEAVEIHASATPRLNHLRALESREHPHSAARAAAEFCGGPVNALFDRKRLFRDAFAWAQKAFFPGKNSVSLCCTWDTSYKFPRDD